MYVSIRLHIVVIAVTLRSFQQTAEVHVVSGGFPFFGWLHLNTAIGGANSNQHNCCS